MNESEDLPPRHVTALQESYPRLFARGTRLEVDFPPGWAGILHALCASIDRVLDDRLAAEFGVVQVKEKFGTLRFYYAFAGEAKVTVDIHRPEGIRRVSIDPTYPAAFPAAAVDAFIATAERQSATTCARCGAPGLLRTNCWMRVTCSRCEAIRAEET